MSVRARIRERVQAGGAPEPAAIARDVLKALPDDELRDALAIALPYLVRDEIRKQWGAAIAPPPTRGGDGPKPCERDRYATPDHDERQAQRRSAGQKGGERFLAAQERRERLLAVPINVCGSWKPLGDCTAADLGDIADALDNRAAQIRARCERLWELAERIRTRGLERVGQLDPDDLHEVLDAARGE